MLLGADMKCVVSEAFSTRERNVGPHLGLVYRGVCGIQGISLEFPSEPEIATPKSSSFELKFGIICLY